MARLSKQATRFRVPFFQSDSDVHERALGLHGAVGKRFELRSVDNGR